MNFSNIAFSEKVTTDFENRAKCLAETKTCVFFSGFVYTVVRRNALTQSGVSPFLAIEIIVLLGH